MKRPDRWNNPRAREVAIEMFRAIINANDLLAGLEASAVVCAMLSKLIAKEEGLPADDLFAAVTSSAFQTAELLSADGAVGELIGKTFSDKG